jgi:alpha-N-acetylglucosamine transferase
VLHIDLRVTSKIAPYNNNWVILIAQKECVFYAVRTAFLHIQAIKIKIMLETVNPFKSNFSANRILPSSYLFWAVKRLAGNYPTVLKEKNMEKQKDYNLRYLLAKVRTI